MKLPAFDTGGLWLFALGLWCNMVARCVYRLPDFAYGLSQALAVGLALVGGYRILNALADRVAEKRLAQEKAAYRRQHGPDGEAPHDAS